MTNDTSTLNGALTELGENMADNLVTKGVTDATASDGLTTLSNKILQIPTGSGITLDTDITLTAPSTVAVGDNVTITASMNVSYDDTSSANIDLSGILSNAPVIFKEGSTVLGTDYSDSNGEATYQIQGITSGTHAYTASFEGSNPYDSSISNSLVITPLSIIFEDACNSDAGLVNYSESAILGDTATLTLTYNSTQNAYQLQLTRTNSYRTDEIVIPIPPVNDFTNYKIKVDFKPNGSSNTQQVGLTFYDRNNLSNNILVTRIMGNGLYIFNANYKGAIINPSILDYIIPNYSVDWYTFEVSKNGTNFNFKLYKSSTPDTILVNETFTTTINFTGVGLRTYPNQTEVKGYIRNIRVTPL